jgi:microcystin-dependent protein
MSEPFLGQITIFAGNFAPRGWAFCNGQILPINQHTALFSLLGTTYGGDGRTTFALPDLRGRIPINSGGDSTGPGLPNYRLGQRGGSHTISVGNLPPHTHPFAPRCSSGAPDESNPADGFPANSANVDDLYSGSSNAAMGAGTTGSTGSGQDLFLPYLAINFIIALQGIFPSRS